MSGSYNKVVLMGNVTRDPVVKTTSGGTSLVEIGLAMNRTYTQNEVKKEEVTFVDITFWGKQAEVLGKYVTKGKPLFVEGRLKYDTWKAEDGSNRSKLRVVGENFQFIGSKGDNASTEKQTSKKPAPKPDDSYYVSDDEIPF